MAQHQRRIDRVLQPQYLADLDRRSLDEIRDMDRECAEIETELSYVRRLAQARLDIIQAEIDLRAAGGSLGDLIDALPKILADDAPRPDPASTRFADPMTPAIEIDFKRGLERLISDATLANLPTLSDAELGTTVEQLVQLESEVSTSRTELHVVMDRLARDLAQRLAVGKT
ncbi:MAG: RsiG family protein [Acidimicrobiia bacterium]